MADDATSRAGDGGNEYSVRETMGDLLMAHFDALWSRAKRERAPRELKWQRNLLTGQGEGPGLTGDHAKADGAWRRGDTARVGRERLRLARQKLTTAKAALGDSIYKSNRVPHVLQWRAELAQQASEEELGQVKQRVTDILGDCNAALLMRDAIEDGGTWGEYWVHGRVSNDTGKPQAAFDIPSPWDMFVDVGNEDHVEDAEYVIRRLRLSEFDVWRLVGDAQGIFDVRAVAQALRSKRSGASSDSQDHPAEQESGRATTDTVEWREVWAYVPLRLLENVDEAALPDAADEAADPSLDMQWAPVMAIFIQDKPVAFVDDPGPRPFARFVWDKDRTDCHPQGIYDAMEDTQEVITGLVRAWLSNLRESSRIVLAGHRDMLRQDPEAATEDGIRWLDLDPDTRDVREAIQQIKLEPLTSGMVEAIEMLMVFADLESNIPRILQGQQPQADQTAFEIRNRLMAAGKYLGEVVRRHDAAIVWMIRWVLHVMALTQEIQSENLLQIRALGFATFSDLVQKIDGLIRLLGLGAQNEQVGARLRTDWIARQIAQAEDIDTSLAFLTEEEVQAHAQAQEQSEERQLALAEAQARVEVQRARAARDAAAAEDYRSRGQLGRAKFIKSVEDDAAAGTQHNTNPPVEER